MAFHNTDTNKVPGYPFTVPPPFPGPHLRTLIPTSFPHNGTYKMIKASAVPQLNHLFRPQVSLGCAWDPIRKKWTISSENQKLHRKMVDNFKGPDSCSARKPTSEHQTITHQPLISYAANLRIHYRITIQ